MSISYIYNQFDTDAHRVFRTAMALRPGPVLRVTHLIHGLISTRVSLRHPELFSPAAVLMALGFNECAMVNAGVPVANSSGLRRVLTLSHQIANQQNMRIQKMICPSCLAVAVLEEDQKTADAEVAKAYLGLGLLPRDAKLPQSQGKLVQNSQWVRKTVDEWIANQASVVHRQGRL
jgi:hypothetical protein